MAHLQSIIAEHLPALIAESGAMSAHLAEMGDVRRDVTLKARLGAPPGQPIARASIAVSAHATGDLGEEKGRTSCEHSIRAAKQATPPEDPGQSRFPL